MFNVGGGELLVIFLVALIVLGPAKLPEVARQIGGVMREFRRISSGFQDEMRAAMEDPIEAAARERGNRVVATSEAPAPPEELADEANGARPGTGAGEAPMSTAAAAGMYDVAPPHETADTDAAPEPHGIPSVETDEADLDDAAVPDFAESDQLTGPDDESSKQAAGER